MRYHGQTAEALALLETLATEIAVTDPIAAKVLRRRILDQATWAEIAPEVGLSIAETQARWQHILGSLRVALRPDGVK